MIETKETVINSHAYQVSQFPAMYGLRKAIKLSKIIGPGIGKAIGEADGLAGIMEKEINLGDAVEALVERFDEHDTTAFILELFGMTHRDNRDMSTEANFNDAYSGNYGEMIQALSFILEVNYGSFFGALVAGTGSPPASKSKKKAGGKYREG